MWGKRILILDEVGFSRICFAILEFEGYRAETIANLDNLATRLNNEEFGLIITSYPFGLFLFDEIKRRNVPIIILSDHINRDLINILEGFANSYCMIKPLDYQKFRSLVKQVMDGNLNIQGGYNLV
ncbi:MAG TPA: DNA-binding response regulator [Nitrospirae bacterium]|nr:DNA-binding response regulator [Nitrospirota bacterium]